MGSKPLGRMAGGLLWAALFMLLVPAELAAQRSGRGRREGRGGGAVPRRATERGSAGRATPANPFRTQSSDRVLGRDSAPLSGARTGSARATAPRRDSHRTDWTPADRVQRWYVNPVIPRVGYPYSRFGYYGNPYFARGIYGYGYRLPNYYVPSYGLGYGYGLGGWAPGIGIGFGLGHLLGHGLYSNATFPAPVAGNVPATSLTNAYATTGSAASAESELESAAGQREPASTDPQGSQAFLQEAKQAFVAGEYAEAKRLAQHAIIDEPSNAGAYELLGLAFFAQGEYLGAAEAAHAAASLGPVPDWPTLYRYYNDRDRYEHHFQLLKQYVADQPDSPPARFLVGLHHWMMGHQESARENLAEYLRLVDYQDPVGRRLFGEAGGDLTVLP